MNIIGLFEKDIFLLENGYISMFLSEIHKWRNRSYGVYNTKLNQIIDHTLAGEYEIVYRILREWQKEYIDRGHDFCGINAIRQFRCEQWISENRNQLTLL